MYIIVSWKTAVYGVEKLLIIFYTHTKQLQKERKKPHIPSGLGTHPETGYTNNFRFPFKSRQGREGEKGTIFSFFTRTRYRVLKDDHKTKPFKR